MLGGLARWLRAAGYDTSWTYGIDDGALVEHARAENRWILSSDAPLCRAIFAEGAPPLGDRSPPPPPVGPAPYPPALFIPRGLTKQEQLRFVLARLSLPILGARCMSCGGELDEAAAEEIRERVPPRVTALVRKIWKCGGCGKLLWEGTHWTKIRANLEKARCKA